VRISVEELLQLYEKGERDFSKIDLAGSEWTFTIRRGFATPGGVENGAKYEITALLRTDTTTVTNIKIA
jgi:hypothetical protein